MAASLVIALLLVATLVLGYLVLARTQSPNQRIADAEVSPRPVVTAQAEKRLLTESVLLDGQFLAGSSQDIAAPASPEGLLPILTSTSPPVGTVVETPSVIFAVAARPVVLFQSQIPLYRTVRSGDTGPDILSLQDSLIAQGYASVRASGQMDQATVRAMTRLWDRLDLDPALLLEEFTPDAAPETSATPDVPVITATRHRFVMNPNLFVFIPTAAGTVVSPPKTLGSTVSGEAAVVTMSLGQPIAQLLAADAQASIITTGDAVTISDGSGAQYTGSVTMVGEPNANGQTVIDTALASPLSADLIGKSFKATVTTATSVDPVLAVPIGALFSDAAGEDFLLDGASGARTDVKIVAIIDGWAQIQDDTTISVGSEVRLNGAA